MSERNGPEDVRNAGYDEWLDAIERQEGYFLDCPNGHGSLPPRRVCPECANDALERTPLPDSGTIDTHTTIHVATPNFADDTPYVTAIADFGLVRLTGQLRGVERDEVGAGTRVTVGVEESETTGERLLVFRPA